MASYCFACPDVLWIGPDVSQTIIWLYISLGTFEIQHWYMGYQLVGTAHIQILRIL